MQLRFHADAWEDNLWWQAQDRTTLKRINKLIDATLRDPRSGIGKPESLKFQDMEIWSRRITLEHRMVYAIKAESIIILQLRYHYSAN